MERVIKCQDGACSKIYDVNVKLKLKCEIIMMISIHYKMSNIWYRIAHNSTFKNFEESISASMGST